MNIVITTKNIDKIEGAKCAFSKFFNDFQLVGIKSHSNVDEQPINEAVFNGAKNRILNFKKENSNNLNYDYFVSVESGLINILGNWQFCSVAVIEDKTGYQSIGLSQSFPIPDSLVKDTISFGLGEVIQRIFNVKPNRGGTISLLTKENVTRKDLTEQAVVMALTKFINKQWK